MTKTTDARTLLDRLAGAALLVINSADERGDTDLQNDAEEYEDWTALRSALVDAAQFLHQAESTARTIPATIEEIDRRTALLVYTLQEATSEAEAIQKGAEGLADELADYLGDVQSEIACALETIGGAIMRRVSPPAKPTAPDISPEDLRDAVSLIVDDAGNGRAIGADPHAYPRFIGGEFKHPSRLVVWLDSDDTIDLVVAVHSYLDAAVSDDEARRLAVDFVSEINREKQRRPDRIV
jgi:hypothetical protein